MNSLASYIFLESDRETVFLRISPWFGSNYVPLPSKKVRNIVLQQSPMGLVVLSTSHISRLFMSIHKSVCREKKTSTPNMIVTYAHLFTIEQFIYYSSDSESTLSNSGFCLLIHYYVFQMPQAIHKNKIKCEKLPLVITISTINTDRRPSFMTRTSL